MHVTPISPYWYYRVHTWVLIEILCISGIGDGWNLTVIDTIEEYEFVKHILLDATDIHDTGEYLIRGSPYSQYIPSTYEPYRIFHTYYGYSTQDNDESYFILSFKSAVKWRRLFQFEDK